MHWSVQNRLTTISLKPSLLSLPPKMEAADKDRFEIIIPGSDVPITQVKTKKMPGAGCIKLLTTF